MQSPDEQIAGQVAGGCGKALLAIVAGLAAFVGLIALIAHAVR